MFKKLNIKNLYSLLAVFTALAMLLAACGQAATPAPATEPPAAPTEAPAPTEPPAATEAPIEPTAAPVQEKVTINWWVGSWKYEDGRAQKFVADFEALNPDIKVEITPVAWEGMHDKIFSALMTGQGPDVVNWTSTWGKEFAATGGLMDVTAVIDEIGRDKFFDGTTAWGNLDGKDYGVPYRMEAKCLFYNKTMFEQAGLANPPKTWAELAEDAKKLTVDSNGDGTPDVYGYTLPLNKGDVQSAVYFRTVLYSFGGDFISADQKTATMNSPEAIQALTYYRDLNTAAVLPPDTLSLTNDDTRILFAEGKAAMVFEGPWGIKGFVEAGTPYGVTTVPALADGVGGWNSQGWATSITEFSKNKEAAIKFVTFMVQPENDAFLTDALPAVKEAGAMEKFQTPDMKVYMDQLNYVVPIISVPVSPAIHEAVTVALQRIFSGEDVTTVANELNEEIQGLLDNQ